MTNELIHPQLVYWRNGSTESDSLSESLAAEQWQADFNLVHTQEEFLKTLAHPGLQLIVSHDQVLSDEIIKKVQCNCPDVVLVVVCEDKSKLGSEALDCAHHVVNMKELDQLPPLLKRSLRRSTRVWSLKEERDQALLCCDMLNAIDEAVILKRADGTITTWNAAASKIFGWKENEAVGRKMSELITNLTPTAEEEIASTMSSVGTWSGEVHYKGKDKREAFVFSRRTFVKGDAKGGTLEVCSDLLEARNELRKSQLLTNAQTLFQSSLSLQECVEQFAKLVVPLMGDACIIDLMDSDDIIRRAAFTAQHPVLAELAKSLEEDVPIFMSNRRTLLDALRSNQPEVVTPLDNLSVFLGVTNEEQKAKLKTVFVNSAMICPVFAFAKPAGVATLLSTDGKRKWLEGDRQRLSQFALTIGSAVENARLHKNVSLSKPKTDSTIYYKDAFLGAVSHELRTPLQAMFGWTQLMRDKKLTQTETEKALDALELSLNAQNKIVNDLLDLSRINSGKLELSARSTALMPLLEQTLESLEVSAGIKQIEIIIEDRTDSAVYVMADVSWMQRAFWNLFSNSVKFTPIGGTITVTASADAQFAEVQIADTGIGIEATFLPHIFEHFSQADTSTTRTHYGLGIGLAITRHVLEAHGGSIEARSPGRDMGATFIIRIPVCASPEAKQEVEPEVQIESRDELTLTGIRILVVEDELDTRNLLTFVLEQAGATVVEAGTVKDGLIALTSARFDILISDIGMPKEDGLSFIRKVRALPPERGGRIPAVALTAYASKEDRMNALRAGYHLHVPKPIDINELLLIVSATVNNPQK